MVFCYKSAIGGDCCGHHRRTVHQAPGLCPANRADHTPGAIHVGLLMLRCDLFADVHVGRAVEDHISPFEGCKEGIFVAQMGFYPSQGRRSKVGDTAGDAAGAGDLMAGRQQGQGQVRTDQAGSPGDGSLHFSTAPHKFEHSALVQTAAGCVARWLRTTGMRPPRACPSTPCPARTAPQLPVAVLIPCSITGNHGAVRDGLLPV